ncbi:MAG: adenylylsulfate kinase [Clostridiales bacterium]|nr:adenylylsulfate kinase [Clostridiales bacterium]
MPWVAPELPDEIPHGDMPGDKVSISETHDSKAKVVFPKLLTNIVSLLKEKENPKIVLTVCGGSGVGKSEIASLISYYFSQMGIGSYTLSGDNYPHRIPKYNDAERLHVFRESGLKGMVASGDYTKQHSDFIHELQVKNDDANYAYVKENPWFSTYLEAGKKGLQGYLGTNREIGFDEVEDIVTAFKNGNDKIWLKRMGREDSELWYEEVDFSNIQILVIEWTHGNSDHYQGVDLPILLNSTPQETLAHRRARNRDGATDSPFTMLVLELEQQMLEAQAKKAKIILSKSCELLSYEEYCKLMEESKGGFHE